MSETTAVPLAEKAVYSSRPASFAGYFRLLHPFPVAANGVAAAAFASLAVRGWAGWRTLLVVAAIVGSQATVGVVNDLRDRDIDATAKPHKPLISGRATVRGAYMLGIASLFIALVTGAAMGWVSLLLVVAMTAAGLIYDLWLKRTAASFLPYVLGLPILPVWAWVCVRDAPPRLWITYPLGVLIGLGLHLANALPDAEHDAATGVRGIVQIMGVARAAMLCYLSFVATLGAAFVLTNGRRDVVSTALFGGAAALLIGAALAHAFTFALRPTATVKTLQRNWGVLIGCAICVAAGWLWTL